MAVLVPRPSAPKGLNHISVFDNGSFFSPTTRYISFPAYTPTSPLSIIRKAGTRSFFPPLSQPAQARFFSFMISFPPLQVFSVLHPPSVSSCANTQSLLACVNAGIFPIPIFFWTRGLFSFFMNPRESTPFYVSRDPYPCPETVVLNSKRRAPLSLDAKIIPSGLSSLAEDHSSSRGVIA